MTRNYTKHSIKNTHRNYNGGYITYFKLLGQLFSKENRQVLSLLPFFNKIWFGISIFFQMIFKPLLWIFHTKTVYDGSYETVNGNLYDHRIKKSKTFYFLRFLPFFHFSTTKLKDRDWETILN
jgi:hypothetical protein